LRELFYEHDVQDILEIDLPQVNQMDRIAWHYEKNGCFSVKSAYRLALSLKHKNRDNNSSSSAPRGDRSIWKCIWKAKVQPKVRVFAWKLATDSLPTSRKNKWRNLEVENRCTICGNGVEDSFHATVTCTKARELREAMRVRWSLPEEHYFRFTGKDWLQLLLGQVNEMTSARILMVLWRAWHLRNDIIHEQGRETIERSISFLESYDCSHNLQATINTDPKGKAPVLLPEPAPIPDRQKTGNQWTPDPSPIGWIKLNTDASFIGSDRPGGAGAVARDSDGKVILVVCSPITRCRSAEQAEAIAGAPGREIPSW
jgi:hypothetical protein